MQLVGIVKGSTLIDEYRLGDVLGDAVRALHRADEICGCFQHRMKAHEVRTLHGRVIEHLNGVLVGRMTALRTLLARIVQQEEVDVPSEILRRRALIFNEFDWLQP